MLIRFSVENFMSFRDEVELSMVAGKQRIHPAHIIRPSKRGTSLLKTSVIYGANASGKSNLIKAMRFAQNLIVNGTKPRRPIAVTTFKLDKTRATAPSRFQFEFRHKERSYIYGFALTAQAIHEEWLYEVTTTTEKALFERRTDEEGNTTVEFSNLKLTAKDHEFLQFVARGTRSNQLFLRECVEREISYFEDAYNWFDNALVIIFPESIRGGLATQIMVDANFREKFRDLVRLFDTGIADIELCEFDLDDQEFIPSEIMNSILEDMAEAEVGEGIQLDTPFGRYVLQRESPDEVKAYKLMTIHTDSENQAVQFDVSEESDGTQRLFDLIPALMELLNGERVFVVDELDRSLHPHLSRSILDVFLRADTGSQLVVTTHESSLLDLELLRRDEIWFVEKTGGGDSRIFSLEEFAPRYDSDIRKGYLLGRFGAIPIVQNASIVDWSK